MTAVSKTYKSLWDRVNDFTFSSGMFNKVIDMIDIPLIRRYRGNSRTHFCREANHCKILRASHHWHLPLVANDIWLGGVAQLDQSVIFWPFLAIKPKCRLAIRAKRHWRSGWKICSVLVLNTFYSFFCYPFDELKWQQILIAWTLRKNDEL